MKASTKILLVLFTLVAAGAFGWPTSASASCQLINGCDTCVNDGGCCEQLGTCYCIEFQCARQSVLAQDHRPLLATLSQPTAKSALWCSASLQLPARPAAPR